jgi:ribosomal protein S18 acetylase RimI-like enzyme
MLKTYWHMRMDLPSRLPAQPASAEVVVRPLSGNEDIHSIASLYGIAFGDDPWPLYWTDFPGLDPDGVFLAWDGEDLAGHVDSYVLPKEKEAYISVVATAPSHRRQGIATALIGHAVDRFRALGFTRVGIDVAADNEPAVRAHEKTGFEKDGEFLADEQCRIPEAGQNSSP